MTTHTNDPIKKEDAEQSTKILLDTLDYLENKYGISVMAINYSLPENKDVMGFILHGKQSECLLKLAEALVDAGFGQMFHHLIEASLAYNQLAAERRARDEQRRNEERA